MYLPSPPPPPRTILHPPSPPPSLLSITTNCNLTKPIDVPQPRNAAGATGPKPRTLTSRRPSPQLQLHLHLTPHLRHQQLHQHPHQQTARPSQPVSHSSRSSNIPPHTLSPITQRPALTRSLASSSSSSFASLASSSSEPQTPHSSVRASSNSAMRSSKRERHVCSCSVAWTALHGARASELASVSDHQRTHSTQASASTRGCLAKAAAEAAVVQPAEATQAAVGATAVAAAGWVVGLGRAKMHAHRGSAPSRPRRVGLVGREGRRGG